jgi:hypothetical protein
VPGLPVEITLRDNPRGKVSVELAGARANTVQVGPCGKDSRDVQVRAYEEGSRDIKRAITMVLPGAVFSQTARVSGNNSVVQCGGSMVVGGHSRKDGAYVSAPLGCLFELRDSGLIGVTFEGETLTVTEAVHRRLMRLPS